MDEDNKIDSAATSGSTPAKKISKKEKADVVYRIYKKESHKDNRCILVGIDEVELAEFNSGQVITVSQEQIKIIGCKFDADGNVTSIPYRWLGVE